jgi:hypothetical protein
LKLRLRSSFSSKISELILCWNMTQFQNSTIDVVRNELKSKSEIFAPVTVVTRPCQTKQPLLSSQRMVGFVCTKAQFVRQLSAESNILRTACSADELSLCCRSSQNTCYLRSPMYQSIIAHNVEATC